MQAEYPCIENKIRKKELMKSSFFFFILLLMMGVCVCPCMGVSTWVQVPEETRKMPLNQSHRRCALWALGIKLVFLQEDLMLKITEPSLECHVQNSFTFDMTLKLVKKSYQNYLSTTWSTYFLRQNRKTLLLDSKIGIMDRSWLQNF